MLIFCWLLFCGYESVRFNSKMSWTASVLTVSKEGITQVRYGRRKIWEEKLGLDGMWECCPRCCSRWAQTRNLFSLLWKGEGCIDFFKHTMTIIIIIIPTGKCTWDFIKPVPPMLNFAIAWNSEYMTWEYSLFHSVHSLLHSRRIKQWEAVTELVWYPLMFGLLMTVLTPPASFPVWSPQVWR